MMEPLAFRDGHALVFWPTYALWVGLEIWGAVRQRAGATALGRDRGSYPLLLVAIFGAVGLGFVVAWRVPAAAMSGPAEGIFALGIVLMLAGVGVRWAAVRTLGRFFTRAVVIQPGQQLIQSGPYRLVRHPGYAGSLLTLLGLGLALTNWLSVVVILAVAGLGYGYRVRVEEQALCAAFGEEYIRYMRRTRRFIPFIF
ncbi:MAG: isoprenylcysteine carboxylmethyltransferase family protein [Chloroflexi bacterium]|nr:isoprenylcysteine carboxylmethyltransferase family protein [Chloroflexota bacterium]